MRFFLSFRRRISKKAYLVEGHDRIRFRRIDSDTHGTEDENLEDKLEASARSGRAGAMRETTGHTTGSGACRLLLESTYRACC